MRDILRSKANMPLMDRLVLTSHPEVEKKMFATYRELMCFLAVLGFEHGLRKPLSKETVDLETRRTFDAYDPFLELLYLLALAETRDGEILLPKEGNEELSLSIFEEYVEGGVVILNQWLDETPDDPYGDKAILQALRKHGFMNVALPSSDPVTEVVF